ncbi:MAG: TlpA family protein disulfide reductase [Syntrophothermus sp.]
MKKLFCFLVMLLFFHFSFSQHYFSFKNLFKPYPARISLFTYHSGKKTLIASDTLITDELRIKIPDSIKPGLLEINFSGNFPIPSCEVIYSGSDIPVFLTHSQDRPGLMAGEETTYYWQKNHYLDSVRNRISDIRQLLVLFYLDQPLYGILQQRYTSTLQQMDVFFDSVSGSTRFKIARSLILSQKYPVPDYSLSATDQRKQILENFFTEFNINDPVFRRSPYLKDKILDYFEIVQKLSESGKDSMIIQGIDDFFARSGISDTVVSEVSPIIRRWLQQNGLDYPAEYLDVKYLSGQCMAENDAGLQERLGAYKRTAKGQPAPEIFWFNEKNQQVSIKDYPGKMLIVFWASWCQHCRMLLPQINQYTKDNNITVVALSLDTSEEAWDQAISALPGWIHLRASGGWNDGWVKLYGVSGTPTIFVLDEKKIISGKTATLEGALELIGQH